MFEQTLLETKGQTSRPLTVTLSFLLQLVALSVLVVIPLFHAEKILPAAFAFTIRAPGPMGEESAEMVKHISHSGAVSHVSAVRFVWRESQRHSARSSFIEPGALLPGTGLSSAGAGVPGGMELGGAEVVPAPPPAQPAPVPKPPAQPSAVRVGGSVQAARLVNQIKPVYPPLARQARVSGVVRLAAIIGTDGRIKNLRVASGHPLLVPAALDAVKQWIYQPTLLNGKAVEVITEIDVNFTLAP